LDQPLTRNSQLEARVEKPSNRSRSFFIVNQEKIRFGIVYFSVIFCLATFSIRFLIYKLKKQSSIFKLKMSSTPRCRAMTPIEGKIFATRKDGVLVPLAIMSESYKLAISPRDIPESYRGQGVH
jgi:hypothetical protein